MITGYIDFAIVFFLLCVGFISEKTFACLVVGTFILWIFEFATLIADIEKRKLEKRIFGFINAKKNANKCEMTTAIDKTLLLDLKGRFKGTNDREETMKSF